MKSLLRFTCTVIALVFVPLAFAAPFANLDFEDATVPSDPLPSWSVNNLGPIYNLACLGSSCVSVHDVGSILADPSVPIEGNFSVFLQGGTSGASGDLPLIGAAISQTGDVPAGAKSIRLLSTENEGIDAVTGYENLRVSLDGSNIPLISLGTVGEVVTLGGNVAPFAGTTAELVISTVDPVIDGPELWAWVDAVSFSTEAIPEPSAGWLIGIASSLVYLGSRR